MPGGQGGNSSKQKFMKMAIHRSASSLKAHIGSNSMNALAGAHFIIWIWACYSHLVNCHLVICP